MKKINSILHLVVVLTTLIFFVNVSSAIEINNCNGETAKINEKIPDLYDTHGNEVQQNLKEKEEFTNKKDLKKYIDAISAIDDTGRLQLHCVNSYLQQPKARFNRQFSEFKNFFDEMDSLTITRNTQPVMVFRKIVSKENFYQMSVFTDDLFKSFKILTYEYYKFKKINHGNLVDPNLKNEVELISQLSCSP